MTEPVLPCETCGEVHDKIYLHSACHTAIPTWAIYNQFEKTLEIVCAECEKQIVKFKVEGIV